MKSETIIAKSLYAPENDNATNASDIQDFFLKIFEKVTTNPFGFIVLTGTFLLMLGSAFLVYEMQDDFSQLNKHKISTSWEFYFLILTTLILLFKAGLFFYNLFLHLRYKPIASVTDELLPTCTVIVPAYNEGRLVLDTLLSLASSDYPKAKLQIIAVDDGSKDDTWQWMKLAKGKIGDQLSIYQQPENKGKRHALYRGFKLGTGDIFVTVDSDSVVKTDTLRNLVSPFIVNKKCGAVAGNVHVLNNDKAILPKMLRVSFVLSFEFVRSAESMLGSVLCTPGALAAYRKDAVLACLEEWVNQTFMGQPSDIGEDRAITNMILKQGYHVLFQRNAYVLTNVPEKYAGLYKMFIRWDRSNVRENIMMSKFIFRNFRKETKAGTRLLFFNQWLKIMMAYPFLLFMLFFIVTHPLLFLTSTLVSILVLSTFPVLFYAKRYSLYASLWAYSYSILHTFGLFWITPYAIATASKKGWLTRDLVSK
ncbi:MAG: glycosyl transferase family 2 [Cytophagaceae bacterium]|jgi:hyaluronan synthase|nr:glycosyl transferase family 2 [Cytophagaceae bacterium]